MSDRKSATCEYCGLTYSGRDAKRALRRHRSAKHSSSVRRVTEYFMLGEDLPSTSSGIFHPPSVPPSDEHVPPPKRLKPSFSNEELQAILDALEPLIMPDEGSAVALSDQATGGEKPDVGQLGFGSELMAIGPVVFPAAPLPPASSVSEPMASESALPPGGPAMQASSSLPESIPVASTSSIPEPVPLPGPSNADRVWVTAKAEQCGVKCDVEEFKAAMRLRRPSFPSELAGELFDHLDDPDIANAKPKKPTQEVAPHVRPPPPPPPSDSEGEAEQLAMILGDDLYWSPSTSMEVSSSPSDHLDDPDYIPSSPSASALTSEDEEDPDYPSAAQPQPVPTTDEDDDDVIVLD